MIKTIMISICTVCEEEHELEVLSTSIDGTLRFTIYRCPITNVTFEIFKPLKNKRLKERKCKQRLKPLTKSKL